MLEAKQKSGIATGVGAGTGAGEPDVITSYVTALVIVSPDTVTDPSDNGSYELPKPLSSKNGDVCLL